VEPFIAGARLLDSVLQHVVGFPLGSDGFNTDVGMTSALLGWSGKGDRVKR